MSATLVTSDGGVVRLGRQLGRGGEGVVHEVVNQVGRVAKTYHTTPDSERQAKLRLMAQMADSRLLSFIAWPEATLHHAPGGPVVGFLMQAVTSRAPIHAIYSPAHRQAERPHLTWDFLLTVARNTAAAFGVVHTHGHVIGDVNQNGLLVDDDAKVALIDSDSFQITAGSKVFRCKVGVPEFTPPELQGVPSLHARDRTPNHDNFGLAVLIFHLLFAGRHPYAGVPLLHHVGREMTADIQHLRYAYAADNQRRGFDPPPRSVRPTIMPSPVTAMFSRAFTERGITQGRPTAGEWKHTLDEVRDTLRICTRSRAHQYPGHLTSCPWCALEGQGLTLFVDLGTKLVVTPSGFLLSKAWALIQTVPPPPEPTIPRPESFEVKPQPLPPGTPSPRTVLRLRLLVVAVTAGLAVGLAAGMPRFTVWALVPGVVGWTIVTMRSSPLKAERSTRHATRDKALADYHAQSTRLRREVVGRFRARRDELATLKDEYQSIAAAEKREVDHLNATIHERQMARHLQTCFIDSASIKGVGPTRKAALRSFGIETAADVDRYRVRHIRGFGEALTENLMRWRRACERDFKFDPRHPAIQKDRAATRAKYQSRRQEIERHLTAGADDLRRISRSAAAREAALRPSVESAARRLAQAERDLAVV
jgi:DNA-binding helix-hairpin-helix protein with protein kinase domain